MTTQTRRPTPIRFTVLLSPEVGTAFRAWCLRQQLSQSDGLRVAIETLFRAEREIERWRETR